MKDHTSIQIQISSLFKQQHQIVLVHSDLMRGFKIPFINRNQFLLSHYKELTQLTDNSDILVPVFNYDFCKGENFNVKSSKSQVGALSEYFRNDIAKWRSAIPIFSFAGNGKDPELKLGSINDPFGTDSIFDYLYKNDAWLLHYGSSISSSTILHYAERVSGKLSYRYDKIFTGKVIDNEGNDFETSIKYHVRPFGERLDYDWGQIEEDLTQQRILVRFTDSETQILLCKIKDLIDFWVYKMQKDPLYFLNNESKMWVAPLLNHLGRPFLITDFETE